MILIATQCFAPDPGGIENLMTGLAAALHRRGHDILVCADRARTARGRDGFPWPVRRFGGPRPWRRRARARYIHRLLRAGGVTHVICDSWKSLEPLSLPAGIPVVCLVHGMEIPVAARSGKRRRIAAALAGAADVVANSRYTADRVRPFLADGIEPAVIHPGVDPPAAPGELAARKAEHRLADFHPRLISVARLEAHKGLDRVLQCLPELLQMFPRLGYLCLGEGPAGQELRRQARELGIDNHVLFAGNADAETRAAFLGLADLFVLPGRAVDDRIEGFGIAYIEAAWQGVPAVAGRAGGAPEAVIHGETGLVCDGDDPGAVLSAVRELLTDERRCRELGANARARAAQFAWDRIVERYETLLA